MKKMMTCFFTFTMLTMGQVWAGDTKSTGGAGAGSSSCPDIKNINVGESCKEFYGDRKSGAVKPVCFGAQIHLYQKKYGIGQKWHNFLSPCKERTKVKTKKSAKK